MYRGWVYNLAPIWIFSINKGVFMALSQIFYTGDGVTRQYVVNFALGYLDQSEVTATVNGVDVTFTWMQDNVASIVPPPDIGAAVVFTRTVPKDNLYVDFEDGAVQTGENLNNAQKQALMAVHEVMDGRLPAFDVIRQDILDLAAADVVLTNAIASEAITRANADSALSTGLATEATIRQNADDALGIRIDNVITEVTAITGAAIQEIEQYVDEAEQYATLSNQYSSDAQVILDQVIATGTGISDNHAYDLGFITDTVTYFDRDMGSITDPVTT